MVSYHKQSIEWLTKGNMFGVQQLASENTFKDLYLSN